MHFFRLISGTLFNEGSRRLKVLLMSFCLGLTVWLPPLVAHRSLCCSVNALDNHEVHRYCIWCLIMTWAIFAKGLVVR